MKPADEKGEPDQAPQEVNSGEPGAANREVPDPAGDETSMETERTVPATASRPDGDAVTRVTGKGEDRSVRRTPRGGTTFSAGDLVADRYEVVRFLARGGMGEVYHVRDRELGTEVALKTILPAIARNPEAMERFRREILLARKVTHPNVCRIFDLGIHEAPGQESVTFFTMELLRGESLAGRLRHGPLSEDAALPIVRQIAEGLDAAHRMGIVHRDLKPGNVFLDRSREEERVVLTDFGLARTQEGDHGAAQLTATGDVLGTPAYMAPEQVEGKPVTPVTDIYALGLVIYRMLTGRLPFEAETALSLAVKRLTEDPVPPRTVSGGIDPTWNDVILRCLERDPEKRFASAPDVVAALTGEKPVPRAARRRHGRVAGGHRWMTVALALAGVVLVGALAILVSTRHESQAGGAAAAARHTVVETRPSVAVLGLQNVTGDPQTRWISTAISEIVTSGLGASGALRIIPGELVSRTTRELHVTNLAGLAPDTLQRLHRVIGADFVVLGAYTTMETGHEATVRLDLRVQRCSDGSLGASWSGTGPISDLFSLASRGVAALLGKLGFPAGEQGTSGEAVLADARAARLYSEGLAWLRRSDPLQAKASLEKAVAADPEAPMPHLRLAEAWDGLGYRSRALEEASEAERLSGKLGREQKLRIRAFLAMMAHRWSDATKAYGSLWSFFPDNPEYGLGLADAQIAAGRPREALETIAELRKLPPPIAGDPRLDLEEAEAAKALGDFKRQLEVATRARDAAKALGIPSQVASAELLRDAALIRLGRFDEAEQAAHAALDLYGEAGNAIGVARARHDLAVVAYRRGDMETARQRFGQALTAARRVGDRKAEAVALNGLGSVALRQGDREKAKQRFEECLAISKEIDDPGGQAQALNNLGVILQQEGDLDGAAEHFQEMLLLRRRMGDKRGEALAARNIAYNRMSVGQLPAARRSFERALALQRELGNASGIAATLQGLGDVLVWMGDLDGAAQQYTEAIQRLDRTGEKTAAFFARVSLAEATLYRQELDGEATRATEAQIEKLARQAADGGHHSVAALLWNDLASQALARGDVTRSEALLHRAQAGIEGQKDPGTAMTLAITAARVQAARGEPGAALDALRRIERNAHAGKLRMAEYEARRARGEILLASGHTAEGRQVLQTLIEEAGEAGWGLAVARARKSLETPKP